MYKWTGEGPRPAFDAERASDLLGRYVLIGITYVTAEDVLLRQEQAHGVVGKVTSEGVTIELCGERAGETMQIPPVFQSLSPAAPGEYRLRSTGETVVDPDFLWTWTVVEPV
ncbi:hypothetical protein [Ferrovibrio sp.]|uniref:hypothetical protein n=1 Tax=Ferrovibrio sp. TaxID=1917215 RepID=UPI003D27DEE7